jgi:phosphatidylcholine synthase
MSHSKAGIVDDRGEDQALAPPISVGEKTLAYSVHVLTASGVVCAFLATAEVCSPHPNPKVVFAWLAAQVVIDAIDGPLARLWRVKERVPYISGRTIDDIVDYLTYTFIPLLLIWRMEWVPAPAAIWVAPAMVASLFGFANTGAKDEGGGFFLGFPSYWNIVAFYLGLLPPLVGLWPGALVIVCLTVMTVLPIRFIYPNLAPPPWRMPTQVGTVVWGAICIWVWMRYPSPPVWLIWVSLAYPVFYVGLSIMLDAKSRQSRRMTAIGAP